MRVSHLRQPQSFVPIHLAKRGRQCLVQLLPAAVSRNIRSFRKRILGAGSRLLRRSGTVAEPRNSKCKDSLSSNSWFTLRVQNNASVFVKK